jgi:RND family efflux transporter MFP subunit
MRSIRDFDNRVVPALAVTAAAISAVGLVARIYPVAATERHRSASSAVSAASGALHEKEATAPLTPVKTCRVTLASPEAESIRYSGSIMPATQVDLAFRVDGYVQEIMRVADGCGRSRLVQEGDAIPAGAVLARVGQSDYAARVQQAVAQLDNSRAGVAQAASKLAESQGSEQQSRAALWESRTQRQTALSQLEEARLGKQQAEEQLAGARAGKEQAEKQWEEAQASKEQAEANVADARASMEQARQEFERTEALLHLESATRPQYETATARYDSARAKVTAAQKQVNAAQSRIDQAQAQIKTAQTKIDQAVSQVTVAQTKIDQAHAQLDASRSRIAQAEARTVSAEAVVRTAQAQVRAAGASAAGAGAQLASARIPFADTALRAPQTGVLLARKVELGTLVGAGSVGFTLADLSRVKVVFGVPDVQATTLALGRPVTVFVEVLGGRPLTGRITALSPVADSKTRVFNVEVTVPNSDHRLKAGMIATLELSSGKRAGQRTVVPVSAIVRSPNGTGSYAVVVISQEGGKPVAHYRDVEWGQPYGNQVVVKGVEPGEQIVASGATMVRDGEPVQVTE